MEKFKKLVAWMITLNILFAFLADFFVSFYLGYIFKFVVFQLLLARIILFCIEKDERHYKKLVKEQERKTRIKETEERIKNENIKK